MRATHLEFRMRFFIHLILITLGFWAPWIGVIAPPNGFASRITLLEWLATTASRAGLMTFTLAAPFFVCVGIVFAALAAALRVWGAAYLGPVTVQHNQMQAGAVMAAGPYRYLRNPLYLGLWFMVAAIALSMPASGALFTLICIPLFAVRLILGEEAFLTAQLGEPYRVYCLAVPRIIPRLRTALPRVAARPQWFRAIFSELAPIGIFLTLALFSWSYNNTALMRGILISLGVSLVARALVPSGKPHFIQAD